MTIAVKGTMFLIGEGCVEVGVWQGKSRLRLAGVWQGRGKVDWSEFESLRVHR